MKTIFALFAIIMVAAGCQDKSTINQTEAGNVITRYLEGNPEYKTITFKYGEQKFNSDKERADLEVYRQLEKAGYVDMILVEQKKKFLSKDSSFVYTVKLNESAQDFVLKQKDNKATVKAVNYILAADKPINFDQVNSKTSKVTVTLRKEPTPFGPLSKETNEFSEFMTKTYKLKLDKEEGWKVDK